MSTFSELISALHPDSVLEAHVTAGIRDDGRAFSEARPLTITTNPFCAELGFGMEEVVVVGSSMVQLGATRVCCGVTLQVGTPSSFFPDQGDIDFEVSLGPLCSPKYDQRGKPEEAYELEALLEAVIKQKTSMVDLSELCIEREIYAFQLYVNVVCLSADGHLPDAALLAAVAALRNVRLPGVIMEPRSGESVADTQVRLSRDASKSRPLSLKCCPVPVTVGVFGKTLLLDPSQTELQGLHGWVRCVMLEDGTMCHLAQVDCSGRGLSWAELQRAVGLCKLASEASRLKLVQ